MTFIVASSQFQEHLTGAGHPERPERTLVIEQALKLAGLLTSQNALTPRYATLDELQFCHTKEYVELVEREVGALQNELRFISTGDCVISPASFKTALLAAGAVLTGVDAIMQGGARNCFCLVRPPGHHATKSAGMGFCLFNNVAIGVRYIQQKYKLKKVLIVDFDVHHGNGTEDIFREDPSVFYFSTHEQGSYPGTGLKEEKGVNNILNCPIERGVGSRKRVLEAFYNELLPAMEIFQPEAVFVSAGFDAHKDDPLGGLDLQESDFAEFARVLQKCAEKFAKGRLISVLEGGYNLTAIAASAVAFVAALKEPETHGYPNLSC